MRLRDYLQLIRRRIVVVVAIVAAVSMGTLILDLSRDPSYEATVRLRARPPAPGSAVNPLLTRAEQQNFLQIDLATEAELVRSIQVAQRVRDELDLPDQPDDLIDSINVVQAPNASVLVIDAKRDNAASAVVLANSFADAYLEVRRKDAAEALDRETSRIRARLADIQRRLQETDARLARLDPSSVEYAAAIADRAAALDDRDAELKQLAELSDRREVAEGFGEIIQPATEAKTVRTRSVPRTAVFGLLIGLPVALAVVLLLDTLRDTIDTLTDAETHTGADVVGLIPIDEGWTQPNAARLASETDPYSPVAEAYRTLAHNLGNLVGDRASILLTSPAAGEGKTATAVNLAVAYADSGRRVALVETDLRHPRAFQFFAADFTPGVAEVLRGELGVRDAVQRVRPRLSYVGPGLPAGRADLLLMRSDLRRLLGDVSEIPETSTPARPLRGARGVPRAAEPASAVVLVDAAPILAAAEVSPLVAAVDGVLLVLRAGVTSRSGAMRATEQIRRAGGNLLGVVLVAVRSPDELGLFPAADHQARPVPASGTDTAETGSRS